MRSSPISARVQELAPYVPGEQPAGGSLIKLNTNENPYPPSPRVAEAVAREAAGVLQLYPSATAEPLREKAAAVYGVDCEEVLVGNGSDEILAMCLRACIDDGDSVAYPLPTYSLYRTLGEIAGARVVEVPAEPGVIPEALAAERAAVTFLCTPNSPTGVVLPLAEVASFAAGASGLVVVDEAYVDFGATSALEIFRQHPNMLVARTFSKSFSLAGLRLGLAFGSRGLVAEMMKVKDSYNVSRLAIAAGVAALDDYAWMESNVDRICATRARVIDTLRERGYVVSDSRANFFWLNCGKEGGAAVYERLRERGVLVRFFDHDGLRSGVRVTVGSDAEMERFLEALSE